jgi:carboxylesterase
MCHPRNAWRLAAALGGPAEVKLLEDSYHMIHVDQERDQVAELTAEFFAGATAAAAARALDHA